MDAAEEIVAKAAGEGGWLAALVAVVLLGAMVALVWLVRMWVTQSTDRELRLGTRIDKIEDERYAQVTALAVSVKAALEQNTAALERQTEALRTKPCLMEIKQ